MAGGADDAVRLAASRRSEAGPGGPAEAGARTDQSRPAEPAATQAEGLSGWPAGAEPVARRTATGWRVGDEEVSDLTSAMVLADLLAAELPTQAMPTVAAAPAQGRAAAAQGTRPASGDETVDPERLQVTVAQLEHALTARVRVEQAIGVLAERHRLRPRRRVTGGLASSSGMRSSGFVALSTTSVAISMTRLPRARAADLSSSKACRGRSRWRSARTPIACSTRTRAVSACSSWATVT